ncbi:MAG: ABC transporter ATP-binding protein [Hyphomicrobiales bacterium]|nr:ABC transporter ATP-binding protein [Hyphomicrobiales bacterium]
MKQPTTGAGVPRLEVEGVGKVFKSRRSFGATEKPPTVALDDVSLTVDRGETFGIVGESGSGKSTLARCILRLHDVSSGRLRYAGEDVTNLSGEPLRAFRRRVQAVFQDASGALDPRMTVGQLVAEPLDIHHIGNRTTRRAAVADLLDAVGMPLDFAARAPHALSGGQRQRIGIARALALDPETILLDEPVSALDVSVQAQVLNLLKDIQDARRLTYVFIVHDLAIAEFFCDRIAVLYRGRIMEMASARVLFRQPQHPYTVSLFDAAPKHHRSAAKRRQRVRPVDDEATATGCVFRARCPIGREREICRATQPDPTETSPGHRTACHFPGEAASA